MNWEEIRGRLYRGRLQGQVGASHTAGGVPPVQGRRAEKPGQRPVTAAPFTGRIVGWIPKAEETKPFHLRRRMGLEVSR